MNVINANTLLAFLFQRKSSLIRSQIRFVSHMPCYPGILKTFQGLSLSFNMHNPDFSFPYNATNTTMTNIDVLRSSQTHGRVRQMKGSAFVLHTIPFRCTRDRINVSICCPSNTFLSVAAIRVYSDSLRDKDIVFLGFRIPHNEGPSALHEY